MNNIANPISEKVAEKFGSYTLTIGILLVVLGTAGIVFPVMMSIMTSVFVAWPLLVGGIIWAVHTYKHSRKNVMDWLKPALLFITGSLLILFPVSGVEVIGMFLSFYLLMDSFSSFSLAQSAYPTKGWGWMVFNGVASIAMATLFLAGWPDTSLWLVGLYVGISLLFDGWAMVFIGWRLRENKKNNQL